MGPGTIFVAVSTLNELLKGTTTVNRLKNVIVRLQILKDSKGQDLIEYALMAGFVAVAAGAIMPGVSQNISEIFSKVASSMGNAASQGS